MTQLYLRTLVDYVLAGAGIFAVMFAVYYLLPRLGAKSETAAGLALIMPWLLGFLLWTLYPIGASLYYSFTDFNGLQTPEWVGIDNYRDLLEPRSFFWPSLRLTLLYGVLSLPLGLALSLAGSHSGRGNVHPLALASLDQWPVQSDL
jgi:multiple sugar transport system permease protein